jgi:hypothetical protein
MPRAGGSLVDSLAYRLMLCAMPSAVGGGKPKMRWYFGREGWPTSSIVDGMPESEEAQAAVIDTLQVRPNNMAARFASSQQQSLACQDCMLGMRASKWQTGTQIVQ